MRCQRSIHPRPGSPCAGPFGNGKKFINRVLNKKEHKLVLFILLCFQFITGIKDRARVVSDVGSPRGSQVCSRRKRRVLCARGQRAWGTEGAAAVLGRGPAGLLREGERHTGPRRSRLCGQSPRETPRGLDFFLVRDVERDLVRDVRWVARGGSEASRLARRT